MSNTQKRMTLSDLPENTDSLLSNGTKSDAPGQSDEEEVRREPRKTISGQDAGTSKSRTQVYQFGKLRSSQG